MPISLTHAMVFAAGFGTRMRPITDTTPKPLIEINGRSMLDRALDNLAESGIENVVINSHYLPEKIEEFIKERQSIYHYPHLVLSHEPEILETGGGIVQALPYLGKAGAFLSLNSDVVWIDIPAKTPAIQRLQEAWNPETMDALLLVHPLSDALGFEGKGDFNLAKGGKLSVEGESRSYVFTGIQILSRSLFKGYKLGEKFSLSALYRAAVQPDKTLNRIYGLVHEGRWLHIGTPESIAPAEAVIKEYEG